jgi:site-specific DNA-methyltransferase (adenine-specific)
MNAESMFGIISDKYLEFIMIENNTIYNEDCLKTMSRMEDKSIDLVVTSPPYNLKLRIRDGKYRSRGKDDCSFYKKYQEFDDDMPIDKFYDLHSSIIKEMLRVSKIICYNFQIVTGSKEAFFQIIGDFKKKIKDIIIWDKQHGQPAIGEKVLNSAYEMILIMEDDDKLGRLIQNAQFRRGEMSNILRVTRKKKPTDVHGAIFPEEVPDALIKAFSKKGDIVYDPFMGSGTTGKMAIMNGRNYIGSEISAEYCAIAEDRIQKAKSSQIFM